MDLLTSLPLFLKGLIASSLVVVELMLGGASSLFTAFTMRESPLAHIPPQPTSSVEPIATSSEESMALASSSKATSTPQKVAVTKTPIESKPEPNIKPASSLPESPLISPEAVNIETRKAIVNILCVARSGSGLRSTSGSGVIIDSRGVILTNAHIAQYFLLKDYPTPGSVDCTIRTGSPASPMYRASLLYLPLEWIIENASQITAEHGLGTGEYDYAFLLIDKTTNPNGALPTSFSNLVMSGASLDVGERVLVAGYPAGFLDGTTIERDLYATTAFTSIGQKYTFDSASNVDVVSLGGTVVSQGGSSGGATVRMHDGKLVGLIATATAGETTSSRDLRAITLGYIDRSLTALGKGGIIGLLSGDVKKAAAEFSVNIAPKELEVLKKEIEK